MRPVIFFICQSFSSKCTSVCEWQVKCFWFSTTLKWQTDSLAPYVQHNGRLFCRFFEKVNSGTSLLTFCEVAHEGELSGCQQISCRQLRINLMQWYFVVFVQMSDSLSFFVSLFGSFQNSSSSLFAAVDALCMWDLEVQHRHPVY